MKIGAERSSSSVLSRQDVWRGERQVGSSRTTVTRTHLARNRRMWTRPLRAARSRHRRTGRPLRRRWPRTDRCRRAGTRRRRRLGCTCLCTEHVHAKQGATARFNAGKTRKREASENKSTGWVVVEAALPTGQGLQNVEPDELVNRPGTQALRKKSRVHSRVHNGQMVCRWQPKPASSGL